MAEKTIIGKFQAYRGTAANLATLNPVLRAGEFSFETDTKRIKVGDGTALYNSLPYYYPVRLVSGILTAANWISKALDLSVSGISVATPYINVSPDTTDSASVTAWSAFGIYPSEQKTNAIKFVCNETPNVNIKVNICIMG